MKKYDCLCLGSCVMDIYRNKESKELRFGGDALNQAIILTKLLKKPLLSCSIGNEQEIVDYLTNNLDTKAVNYNIDIPTTTSIITLDENGERSFEVIAGAHRKYNKSMFDYHWLKEIKALSIASIFSMDLLEEDGLVEILKETKQNNVLVFADTSKDRYQKGMKGIINFLPYIDYFCPSFYEIADILKTDKLEDILKTLEPLTKNIIIKMGREGCYLHNKEVSKLIPTSFVETIDTTGAGDTFMATLISEVTSGTSLEIAIKRANYLGGLSTTYIGSNSININNKILEDLKSII